MAMFPCFECSYIFELSLTLVLYFDDDENEAGIEERLHSTKMQSSSLKTYRKGSDGLFNRIEPVKQDFPSGKQTTDLSNYGDLVEGCPDNDKPIDDSDGSGAKSSLTGDIHIHTVTKSGVIKKLKNMFGVSKKVKEVKVSISEEKFLEMSSKVGKKQLHNKKIAPIIIWDFGGQDVFYSTHQTFLTYRAIYMIVMDGSRKLDDPSPNKQYLPGKGAHKTARGMYQD
ncbi:Hypothetical predicted protein [Mytilus galloprovincialis]|uniref:Uncharacterized protein n=1 Tax=Mytilus galloprovincialis TaxID=29158 RepID=A0A8B6BHU1_MYTGA|nr:Hypothetical predicted protein [Mytilus galloprovincialis]